MRTLQHPSRKDTISLRVAVSVAFAIAAALPRAAAADTDVAPSIEHRRLQQADDSGRVRIDGLEIALGQRFAATGQSAQGSAWGKVGGVFPAVWSAIGPSSVGGRVRAVVPHPTIAGRLLAGSVSGGVWRRASASVLWQPINDFLPNMSITCLVHDPSVPATVYACTGEGPFNPATGKPNIDSVRGAGILRSIDGGESWVRLPATDPRTAAEDGAWNFVNRLAVRPGNPNFLLAATHRGLLRSADAGISWSTAYGTLVDGNGAPSLTAMRRVNDVKFHPADGTKALLGEQAHLDPATGAMAGGAVAWSNDAGATWTRLPLAGADRVEVSPAAGVPGLWFALVNANGGELWRIQNSGTAWTATKVSTPANLGADGWYAMALWVSPDGARILVGGAQSRFSVDGGATFGPPITSLGGRSHAFVADPQFAANGTVYAGTDAGVYLASGANVAPSSGPAFAAANEGLAITQFNDAAGASALGGRIIGGAQDLGTFTWTGSGWIRTAGESGGRTAVDPVDPLVMYGTTPFLGIFRSVDAGATSQPICAGIPDSPCGGAATPKANFLAPFAIDRSNGLRMLAGGETLWRTDNARAAQPVWTAVKPPAPASPANPGGNFISAIAVSAANPDIAWVGLNDGRLYRTANARAATPAWGEPVTWEGLDASPRRMITRILVDDDNPDIVYVAFGGYSMNNLLVTGNGGATWTSLHSGTNTLPAAPIRSVARHPSRAGFLYVGTEVGVYASENGGLTWSTSTEGPGSVPVERVFWLDGTTLVAATHGRGMFRATVSVPSAVGTLQFDRTQYAAIEGSTATLTVTRSGGASGPAQVNWSLENGTAIVGSDVTAASGTFSWVAGDATPRTITLNVAADGPEGMESFVARLSGATGAILAEPRAASVRILDPLEERPSWLVKPAAATRDWTDTADEKFEGNKSLRSAPIGANETAAIEVTAAFPAGTLAFARRVSSLEGSHFLRFSIDGVVVGQWSGEVPWDVVTYPLAAGTHTLRWTYAKDAKAAGGLDAAWIDALTLPRRYAVAGDEDNDGMPNAIEFQEGRNPDLKDNDIFANSRWFAMQQYRDLLSREGEEPGIQGWATALDAGTINRTTAVQIFLESPEFASVVAPVARLYFAYFLRIPDYAGLIGWVQALKTGWTLPQISNQFALSAEFTNLYGSLGNGQFVTLAYQNVLGRAPDAAGYAYWVGQLDAGLLTRGDVMIGLSESTEYRNAMTNEVTVTSAYIGLLRRAPDLPGFNGWVAILDGGAGPSALIGGIINSGEYRARFLP